LVLVYRPLFGGAGRKVEVRRLFFLVMAKVFRGVATRFWAGPGGGGIGGAPGGPPKMPPSH
jgi:hypothetical protein